MPTGLLDVRKGDLLVAHEDDMHGEFRVGDVMEVMDYQEVWPIVRVPRSRLVTRLSPNQLLSVNILATNVEREYIEHMESRFENSKY